MIQPYGCAPDELLKCDMLYKNHHVEHLASILWLFTQTVLYCVRKHGMQTVEQGKTQGYETQVKLLLT